jgi:dTDP-4-amino-4,6-dideoxygalactose transaminase
VHGQGVDKYDNVRIGINGRMDTLQAAILLKKLAIFDDEIVRRERVAARYGAALSDVVTVPQVPAHMSSVWAQYTIKLENRDSVAAALKSRGVPTAVYYPLPLHRQTAYKDFPRANEHLEISERLSQVVLSLPMHPYLDEHTQDRIVNALQELIPSGQRKLE